MVKQCDVNEVEIDERTVWVRPVGSCVVKSNNVVAEALAVSMDKPLERVVGFFVGNTELSLELWTGDLRKIRIRRLDIARTRR